MKGLEKKVTEKQTELRTYLQTDKVIHRGAPLLKICNFLFSCNWIIELLKFSCILGYFGELEDLRRPENMSFFQFYQDLFFNYRKNIRSFLEYFGRKNVLKKEKRKKKYFWIRIRIKMIRIRNTENNDGLVLDQDDEYNRVPGN